MVHKSSESFLKLPDGTGTQRVLLQQQGTSGPRMLLYDDKGQVIEDRLEKR